MTHPQWPPETLVGSFAQQVFSLMVSELWSGVESSPVELLERPLLAAPQLVAGGGTLARGSGNPSPSRRGCFGLPWSDGRGQPRGSDSGVISVQLSTSNRGWGASAATAALGTDGGASIKCSVA